MDYAALQSDPAFMSLPFAEKVKAMAMIDRRFGALKPEEQHKGLAMLFPPDVRDSIEERKAFPPANQLGDQNSNSIGAGDYALAATKGLARLAGAPTSMEEIPGAAKNLALNGLTAGTYGPMKAMAENSSDLLRGNVPRIVSGAAQPFVNIAAPANAVIEGRPPTNAENLNAVESGTGLAGTIALQHPAVSGAISRMVPEAGAAIEGAGNAQYADALAQKGSPQRPLAETIGSQLAAKGKVMSDPRSQLRNAFGGYETQGEAVQQFKKGSAAEIQRSALQEKYPQAEIVDDGEGGFLIRERGKLQTAADELADSIPKQASRGTLGKVLKVATRGGLAGAAGTAVGGPVGGLVAATALEGTMALKNAMRSPLWKTASGSIKTTIGKAMQAQDFGTVVSAAARIGAGENLADSYGHDQALHGLVTSLMELGDLGQNLQDYDAVYFNPDGSYVQVPRHVTGQTFNALTRK